MRKEAPIAFNGFPLLDSKGRLQKCFFTREARFLKKQLVKLPFLNKKNAESYSNKRR